MRLIQLFHPGYGRRIAMVEEPQLILLDKRFRSNFEFFKEIIEKDSAPENFILQSQSNDKLDYDRVYEGSDEWKILPAYDHPDNPHACLLSGTGLTHKASATNRQNMHEKLEAENNGLTDSMKIYLWGEQEGKPKPGCIGVQPEWFYKGNGSILKGHGESLLVPPYADDGGDEPEVAGIYYVDKSGTPHRIGFATANEFSDHIMEKKNYLYLAPSKLRTPALGPELILNHNFQDLEGEVSVTRGTKKIWSKTIHSGECNMAHSLSNLEYHHFKYDQHRIPDMVHIHFFGADSFSFGDNIQLQDGDRMSVRFDDFGRALQNPVSISHESEEFLKIKPLYH